MTQRNGVPHRSVVGPLLCNNHITLKKRFIFYMLGKYCFFSVCDKLQTNKSLIQKFYIIIISV